MLGYQQFVLLNKLLPNDGTCHWVYGIDISVEDNSVEDILVDAISVEDISVEDIPVKDISVEYNSVEDVSYRNTEKPIDII